MDTGLFAPPSKSANSAAPGAPFPADPCHDATACDFCHAKAEAEPRAVPDRGTATKGVMLLLGPSLQDKNSGGKFRRKSLCYKLRGMTMQVRVENYAQLRDLCWNRPTDTVLDGSDALAIYERNWRFVDEGALSEQEQVLLDTLVARYGNGVLNV